MFDKTGDDAIYYREFIAGIAPLISADVKEKVDFSLQMYDTIGTGKLKQDEVIKLLSAINRTASYFGDPCLTEQQVTTELGRVSCHCAFVLPVKLLSSDRAPQRALIALRVALR